jgi:hypothetical protein
MLKNIGNIIASFIILFVLVAIFYLGFQYAPNLQTSVILEAVKGELSFQVDHPVALRTAEVNKLTVSLQETEGNIFRAGYIDIAHDPATEIGAVEKASAVEVIHVERLPNYTRVYLASKESNPSAQLRPLFKISVQINQVPFDESVLLALSGSFGGTQVPANLFDIAETLVNVPVVFDATHLETRLGNVVAQHEFLSSEIEVGQIVDGIVSLSLPENTHRVFLQLRYPADLKVSQMLIDPSWIAVTKEVDRATRIITIDAHTENESTPQKLQLITISYEALSDGESGVGVEVLKAYASQDSLLDLFADDDLREVNNHDANLVVLADESKAMVAMEEPEVKVEDVAMEEKPTEIMEVNEPAKITTQQVATLLNASELLVPLVWDDKAVQRNAGKAVINPYIRAANMLGIIKIDKSVVVDAVLTRAEVLVMADRAASYLFEEAEASSDSNENIKNILGRNVAILSGNPNEPAPHSELKELVDGLWEQLLK